MSLAVTEEAFNASGYVAATNTTAENLSNATVSLSMQVVASTLTDNDNVSATTFTGELGFTVAIISNESDTENYPVPTLFSLDGLFETGDESFSAGLSITSSGDFTSEDTDDLSFGESATN